MANNNLVLQLLITARDTASEVVGRVGAGVRGIGDAVSAALEPLRTFGGLMAAAVGIGGAKELQDRADAYTRLTNSLKVATKSEEEYLTARKAVIDIAGRTNSDLETTASLYARISQNAETMNISQSQTADLTELIAKGMQLGGASAEEYSAATLQLTQAFGAGVLRGEEFNSVMEASPELMRQLAAGLGVTIGELRGLAEQGVLTSSLVSQALLSQKDAIDAAYGETVKTVEQAFTNLSSKITLFVGQLGESTGASSGAANAIQFLSENLNVVAATLGGALVASIAKSTTAMVGYVQASLAARAAAKDQAVLEASRAAATVAAAESQVAATQAAYNRALAEQRLAQQIVVAMQAELGYGVTEAELAAARTRAAAAANAATTATQRYAAAQAELAALQASAATSAGLFSRAMGFLAGPGGLILLAVSAFAALLPMLSKNKTETEELATSTEAYADSLKKMNENQLKGQLIRLDEAITRQREAVEKATAAGWEYADYLDESTGKTVRVERNTLDLALARENLANETDKLTALEEKRIALSGAMEETQNRQTNLSVKEAAALSARQVAMVKYIQQTEDLAKQQKAVADAEETRIESEIALAQASGNLQKVESLTLQLAEKRAKAAQDQAELDRRTAAAAQIRVTAMESEYQGYQKISPVQAKALADAQADAAAKDAQAKASNALAVQLEQQADRSKNSNLVMEDAVKKSRDMVSATERLVDAQSAGLRAEIGLANAKGETAKAQRLSWELAIKEAEGAVKVAQAKEAQQVMEYALAVAKRNQVEALFDKNQATQQELDLAVLTAQAELAEAQAAGVNTQAQMALVGALRQVNAEKAGLNNSINQNTQSTEANSAAQQVNIQHTKDTGQAAAGVAAYLDQARQETDKLSESTRALFEVELAVALNRQGFEGSAKAAIDARVAYNAGIDASSKVLANYATELNNANQLIDQSEEKILFAMNGFRKWEAAIELATGKAKKGFYEQAIAAEQLRVEVEKLGTQGVDHVGLIGIATQALENDFNLLDEQDLAGLRSAIDAANDKLREMQDEAESAQRRLIELDAEIAAEQGDSARADRLKLELDRTVDLREAEQALQDARNAGNREAIAAYETQIQKIKTLYELKERNLTADKNAADSDNAALASADKLKNKWDEIGQSVRGATSGMNQMNEASGALLNTLGKVKAIL